LPAKLKATMASMTWHSFALGDDGRNSAPSVTARTPAAVVVEEEAGLDLGQRIVAAVNLDGQRELARKVPEDRRARRDDLVAYDERSPLRQARQIDGGIGDDARARGARRHERHQAEAHQSGT
jgi:hypothetical protein